MRPIKDEDCNILIFALFLFLLSSFPLFFFFSSVTTASRSINIKHIA